MYEKFHFDFDWFHSQKFTNVWLSYITVPTQSTHTILNIWIALSFNQNMHSTGRKFAAYIHFISNQPSQSRWIISALVSIIINILICFIINVIVPFLLDFFNCLSHAHSSSIFSLLLFSFHIPCGSGIQQVLDNPKNYDHLLLSYSLKNQIRYRGNLGELWGLRISFDLKLIIAQTFEHDTEFIPSFITTILIICFELMPTLYVKQKVCHTIRDGLCTQ